MVAGLMQLTAQLRALSDLVVWIMPRLDHWRAALREMFKIKKKKNDPPGDSHWNMVVNNSHCSPNPYLCKWAARELYNSRQTHKTSETWALTMMLRLNHPLANAANEWESASRLTALILLHRLSCCSPETDQYHLLNTQEAQESIKGLLLSN